MKARRLPVVDEYFEGDECAVMIGDNVIVLSALATELLDAVGETGVQTPALARALEERYGPPPGQLDSLTATENALRELEKYGLVHLSGESE